MFSDILTDKNIPLLVIIVEALMNFAHPLQATQTVHIRPSHYDVDNNERWLCHEQLEEATVGVAGQ